MSSNASASGNNNNENTASPDARLRLVEHAAAATTTATTTAATTTRITTSIGSRQSSSHAANDVVDAAASTSPTNRNNNKNNNNTKHDKEADGTSSTSETRYGKCKWFNVAKGWGFITPNDGGVEVFVHQSVIQMNGFRSLGEQEDVEFESEVTPRGVEATRVAGREGFDCVGSNFRPRPHGARFVRRVRCYNCNKFNHIAAECRLEPQPRRCYICQQEDHLIADCPRTATQPITASANTSDSSAPAEGEPNAT